MDHARMLGAAWPGDRALHAMVAAQLGAQPDEVTAVQVSEVGEVDYELPAITTASRHWVGGSARIADRDVRFRFFVKVVQSFARSPMFDRVPPEVREEAAAFVPWRTEPAIYRSALAERLPAGLRMPVCRGVYDLDDDSSALWLDEVRPSPGEWDVAAYHRAATLVARLAASHQVASCPVPGATRQGARAYFEGRIRHQVMPILAAAEVWRVPLVAAAFDNSLREQMLAVAHETAALVDELEALPQLAAHGDTSPNNLLFDGDGFVLIDFGFWGEQPVGFDLAQLVFGERQMGRPLPVGLTELDRLCLAGYLEGLSAEGNQTVPDVVARGHALKSWIYTGISSLPIEFAHQPVTADLRALAAARAEIAAYTLDRLDATVG